MVSQAVVTDPSVVLGRLATELAHGVPVPEALEGLVRGLGLRTAVLRSASGELLGVGGEVVHAVPVMRAVSIADADVELPVVGPASEAALTVMGARPSQLPVLRAAAAVLALALAPATGAEQLLDAAEADRDEIADALHDGPVQALVVARYAADAAVRGGDAVMARDAVQDALVEVRRALWALRPRGSASLREALQQLSAQRVKAGGAALEVLGDGDLSGTPAVLAYRLVQALDGPSRVVVRRQHDVVVLELDGTLPSPERWAGRARALGGDLSFPAGLSRLVLPVSDARTTS